MLSGNQNPSFRNDCHIEEKAEATINGFPRSRLLDQDRSIKIVSLKLPSPTTVDNQ
jgi:hypothetical protein